MRARLVRLLRRRTPRPAGPRRAVALRVARRLLTAPIVVAALWAAAAGPVLAQGFGGTVEDILVRADSLLAQQRSNEAMVQYQEARTLCATSAQRVAALEGEARAHLQMKEFLPAAGLLEEAATRYPDDPRLADILYLAGYARQEGGDREGSVGLLQKALEHHPTPDVEPAIKYQLARSLRLSGKPDEVIPLLKDFEAKYPMHILIPNALYTLGIAQHDDGDLKGSEATYRHLIETYPHSQATLEGMYELGLVLQERGERKEAAEFFRRYANGNPNSPVAARSMERAADLTFFSSPREAAMLYGVAQVKARTNPVPPVADLQVTHFIGVKRAIANALSTAWIVATGAGVLLVLAVLVFVWLRRRGREARRGAEAGA